jgi:hypothetical protein
MQQDFDVMKQYEAILKTIKEITKADDCSIFLLDSELEMDIEEKKEVFDKRIKIIMSSINTIEPYYDFLINIDRERTVQYSILTYFVGTEEHWRLKKGNYKKRPHKYVVFNWDNNDNSKSIAKEGITAYTARTGNPVVIMSRHEVRNHASFCGINEGENLIHDSCAQVAMIPIKTQEEHIIGVIRCDIYNPDIQPVFQEDTTLLELEKINDILCKIIHLGKDFEDESSYDKLFHGINLLRSLKEIKEDIKDNTDNEIYNITKKLFYVLKRRRYFGYLSIMGRIEGYIGDICDILDLDRKPIEKLLESFRKHEDLMLYSNANYRDHFMHQFHVFVVGYIILHYLGIDIATNALNDNLAIDHDRKLGVKNILRIWFLSSFFHDNCYILSDFDSNIGNFLTDILVGPSNQTESNHDKFKFSVALRWGQLVSKNAGFLEKLSKVAEYIQVINQDINISKLTAELYRAMVNRDHGVLSSLVMLQTMSQANKSRDVSYNIEKYIAASSIALHTNYSFTGVKNLIGKTDKDHYIYFEKFPISFLLSYCDFIQEWGRRHQSEELQKWGSPILHSLYYDRDNEKIVCNLLYNPDSFYSYKQQTPMEEQLEIWAREFREAFRSMNFNFHINYFEHQSPDPDLDDLLSKNPLYSINLKQTDQRRSIRRKCDQFCCVSLDGRDYFYNDFSDDSISGIADIGFGTNSEFSIDENINMKFVYGDYNLSGRYEVKRINDAAPGMPFTKFVGVKKIIHSQ